MGEGDHIQRADPPQLCAKTGGEVMRSFIRLFSGQGVLKFLLYPDRVGNAGAHRM